MLCADRTGGAAVGRREGVLSDDENVGPAVDGDGRGVGMRQPDGDRLQADLRFDGVMAPEVKVSICSPLPAIMLCRKTRNTRCPLEWKSA